MPRARNRRPSTLPEAGGATLYRRAIPFFLGLMLGYFGGVAVSFVVDFIWFPGEGHGFHNF